MFGVDSAAAQKMYDEVPHTFTAISNLMAAMDDCAKKTGKKTWFGKDKGVDSYVKFKFQITRSVAAMSLDGLVREATSDEDVAHELEAQIARFAQAFPTWSNAYVFSLVFFADRDASTATISRAR